MDFFEGFYKFLVVFIYGSSALIVLIFSLFLKLYLRLDELLSLNFCTAKIISSVGIYRNVLALDQWLAAHNRTAGFILFIFAVYDLFALYNVQIAGLF